MQPEPDRRALRAQAVGLGDAQRVDGLPEGRLMNVAVLAGDVHDARLPLLTVPPAITRTGAAVMLVAESLSLQQTLCV